MTDTSVVSDHIIDPNAVNSDVKWEDFMSSFTKQKQ